MYQIRTNLKDFPVVMKVKLVVNGVK